MFLGIDHLIILVKDLDEAAASYKDLGFQISPGGKHAAGTHNALVGFRDGTYLELLAFQDPEGTETSRFFEPLKRGEGFVDFGAWVEDADKLVEHAHNLGLSYGSPYTGGRKRDDGIQLQTRMVMTIDDAFGVLPLFFQPLTDRSLRVPSGDAVEHDNSVIGLHGIVVAVNDLGETGRMYSQLLEIDEPEVATDSVLDATTMTFPMGPQSVTLASPVSDSSPVAEHLAQRGESPFEMVLISSAAQEPYVLDPNRAHGARLSIRPS